MVFSSILISRPNATLYLLNGKGGEFGRLKLVGLFPCKLSSLFFFFFSPASSFNFFFKYLL